MTSTLRHCVGLLCAPFALTLLACVDSPMSAVREEGRTAGDLSMGKTSVDGGVDGMRREIAYLKRVSASPALRDGFRVGIAGKPNATVDDLLAILEHPLPNRNARNETMRAATLDSSTSPVVCYQLGGVNSSTCVAIYSTIGRDHIFPLPRNVTFAAGTSCTSGVDCSRWGNLIGGTMHSSLALDAGTTVRHTDPFSLGVPSSSVSWGVLLTSLTPQPASVWTAHWIQLSGQQQFPVGTSATSGSI